MDVIKPLRCNQSFQSETFPTFNKVEENIYHLQEGLKEKGRDDYTSRVAKLYAKTFGSNVRRRLPTLGLNDGHVVFASFLDP